MTKNIQFTNQNFKDVYLHTVDGGGLKYIEVRGITEKDEFHTFTTIYYGTRKYKYYEQAEPVAKKKMTEVTDILVTAGLL